MMSINTKYRVSATGLPVLSIQSGKQLINEVAEKSALTNTTKSEPQGVVVYLANPKKAPSKMVTYQLNQNELTQTRHYDKGTLLNAVA
ncbi:hypothetical protein MACH09_32240 [Vibrio sp. MACH09]|nr:hypothetical protein [Vibrio sp. MACH09]NOI65774.1 hypothetical protein [Vibrio sp. 99-8-1]GLO62716.1 hypothetical protein MACH09_32240 [Vibrio sp. MACH09]